jgi:hypothetical protein
LKKTRELQAVKRSGSQPQTQTKMYMGNKVLGNNSVQSGSSYKKSKFGEGGCGCGKRPKKVVGLPKKM